jgi:hypothetical protein
MNLDMNDKELLKVILESGTDELDKGYMTDGETVDLVIDVLRHRLGERDE